MERHKYTEEQFQFLRDNVEGTTLQEQTDRFNKRFGTNLTKEKITAIKSLHKIKPKTPMPRSTNNYTFKKGQSVYNKYKVGDIRFCVSSHRDMYEIKVAPNTWRPYHHVLYEQYHNVKLPPDAKVIFIDKNRTNLDKDNLKWIQDEDEKA